MENEGKSKVGKFLQSISGTAGSLLNTVGSLSGMGGLTAIGQAIMTASPDVLSDSQKAQAMQELQLDMMQENERTTRHKNDMSSDSWLSKNIRPMTLIFLLFIISLLAILDSMGGKFSVNSQWINLFGGLALSVFGFYFVGREAQKLVINKKG